MKKLFGSIIMAAVLCGPAALASQLQHEGPSFLKLQPGASKPDFDSVKRVHDQKVKDWGFDKRELEMEIQHGQVVGSPLLDDAMKRLYKDTLRTRIEATDEIIRLSNQRLELIGGTLGLPANDAKVKRVQQEIGEIDKKVAALGKTLDSAQALNKQVRTDIQALFIKKHLQDLEKGRLQGGDDWEVLK